MKWRALSPWLLTTLALSLGFLFLVTNKAAEPAHASTPDPALGRRAGTLTDLTVYPYLLRASGQRADPINLLFVGTTNVQAVAALIRDTLGWRSDSGSTMFFVQGNEIQPQDAQVASSEENGRRYHLRLKLGQGLVAGKPFILGAVHVDERAGCGHVGREFDAARDFLKAELAWSGLRVEVEPWNNTGPARHCDGSETAGDGLLAVVELPQS